MIICNKSEGYKIIALDFINDFDPTFDCYGIACDFVINMRDSTFCFLYSLRLISVHIWID